MDVGNQGTKLRITNISEDVSEFLLLLYLEKILPCHVVDVSHSQGNPDATVTVRGPGINISTVQSAADEVPLSNQVVTISVLEEDASLEGVGDGDLRAVGSSELTADEEERSWWSPPRTVGSPQAATNYGVTVEGDTLTSTNEAGPMDFETESTSALGAARHSSTDAAEDVVGSTSGKIAALSEVGYAPTEEHNTRTEKAITTKTAPAMKSGKKNIKRAKPKKQRETIAIPPEKWKLMLCLLKIKMEEDDSFKFHVNEKTHSVSVENVNDVLEVYEIMAVIFEVCMREISPRLAELLGSKKGQEALENSSIHATFFVRENDVFLVTDSEDTETRLRDLIKKEEMPLLEFHKPYLQSQKWSDVRKNLSEKYLVDFAVEERKILMTGVHTELASRELGNELSRNATTKESLKFKPGEGRYIKERGDHSLDTVRSKRDVKINLKEGEAGKPWEVEISGHVSNVKTAREEIKKLFETLDEDTKEYTDAGARAFFGSTNTKRSLKGIEGEKRSIIEVEDGKASTVPFLLSSSKASNSVLDSLLSVIGCGSGSGRDDGSAPIVRPKDRLRRKPRRQLKAAPPKPNEDHLLLTTGGVSLYLSYGDITGYKAGVLVNTPVAECASFARGGAVANAFLKKGGQELEQAYFNQRGQSSDERDDIISTPACGQLQSVCSHVFHMRLRKWSRRTERSRGTQSKLQFYIKNCLRRCVNDYGATSIAFPTVGCGQFHYPVDKVANAFEYVLKAFAADGHTMKVTLVAFDEDIYDKVLDYFEPRRPRRPRVSLVDSDQSSDEESDQEGQGEEEEEVEEVEEDNVEDAATEGAEDQHLRKIMVPAHAGVRLRVYGACKDSIRKTFEKVDDLISNSIVEEDIKHPDMKNLPLSTLRKLGSLNSEELAVTVDQSKGVVRLAGMSKSVSKTRASINLLLQEAGWDHLPANQKRLLRLADDKVPVPNSWTKFILKKDKKGKPKIPETKLVEVDNNTKHAVETIVATTWRSHLVGQGNDAVGLSHTSIKITKVRRVENYGAWQTYNSKRNEYFRKAALDSQLFPKIAGLDGESDVLTRTFKLHDLDELIEPEINEVFLFHGTKKENLKAITKQGLDFRVGKEGEKHAMFGKGVYFAESSTKADQYADEKPARSGGEHHMILARVILGNPFICHKPDKMSRPPCTHCQSPECKEHGAFYDSVIGIKADGNRRLLFREFIVYDTGMCYPEFVITYERQ